MKKIVILGDKNSSYIGKEIIDKNIYKYEIIYKPIELINDSDIFNQELEEIKPDLLINTYNEFTITETPPKNNIINNQEPIVIDGKRYVYNENYSISRLGDRFHARIRTDAIYNVTNINYIAYQKRLISLKKSDLSKAKREEMVNLFDIFFKLYE